MFSQEQLQLIEKVARSVKNQGEIAVANKIYNELPYIHDTSLGFTGSQIDVITYCAEECKRQHSGEMSVYWMVNAWDWMIKNDPLFVRNANTKLTLEIISHLGALVEPNKNIIHKAREWYTKSGIAWYDSFRRIPIGVGDGMCGWIEKAEWTEVPCLLTLLLESYYEGNLGPVPGWFGHMHEKSQTAEDQFYYEYENIHPFVDGNGRTGKILYNYLLGKLDDPIIPPNFWGGSNP